MPLKSRNTNITLNYIFYITRPKKLRYIFYVQKLMGKLDINTDSPRRFGSKELWPCFIWPEMENELSDATDVGCTAWYLIKILNKFGNFGLKLFSQWESTIFLSLFELSKGRRGSFKYNSNSGCLSLARKLL